jgi:predicted small lipoprotein YifL
LYAYIAQASALIGELYMRTPRLFFIIAVAALLANACGYRGPLYMPDPAATPNTIQVNSPAVKK